MAASQRVKGHAEVTCCKNPVAGSAPRWNPPAPLLSSTQPGPSFRPSHLKSLRAPAPESTAGSSNLRCGLLSLPPSPHVLPLPSACSPLRSSNNRCSPSLPAPPRVPPRVLQGPREYPVVLFGEAEKERVGLGKSRQPDLPAYGCYKQTSNYCQGYQPPPPSPSRPATACRPNSAGRGATVRDTLFSN